MVIPFFIIASSGRLILQMIVYTSMFNLFRKFNKTKIHLEKERLIALVKNEGDKKMKVIKLQNAGKLEVNLFLSRRLVYPV